MQKQHKEILRTLVTALRHRLAGTWDADGAPIRGDLDRELERLGFAPDGHVTPMDALVQPTAQERRAYQVADARISPFADAAERRQARAEVADRAAYTWINRLLTLRTMEARGLTDETLRPNTAYDGISEALYILRHSDPARTQGPDGGWQAVLDDACETYAAQLRGLFDPNDPNVALCPTSAALLDCIRILGGDAPGNRFPVEEVDAVFRDPDVLGWAYQFYQQEAKDRVYAKLGRGGKIETRSEIAAATQLFTESYMVKWMLQNSLGRLYHEAYPESKLPETWEYYIRSGEEVGSSGLGGEEGAESATNPTTPTPQHLIPLSALTLIDVSMGSGHILREGFDMLFAMYREQYPEMDAAEIAQRILNRHIFGIDIDPRAAQLAAVTLVLRAWEVIRAATPNRSISSLPAFALNLATTPTLVPGALDRHLKQHPEDEVYRPILAGIFAALEQAPLLGSLLRPEEQLDAALAAYRKQAKGGQMGLLGESAAGNRLLEEVQRHDPAELKRLLLERIERSFGREAAAGDVGSQLLGREAGEGVHLLQLLGRRYAVACTNPPYMGSGALPVEIQLYLDEYFHAGKHDLYSSFILRCIQLTKHLGRTALITMHGWLFQKSYTELREGATKDGILYQRSIEGIVHLGRYAFSELGNAVIAPVLFAIRNLPPSSNHRIWACRLTAPRPSSEQALLLHKSLAKTEVVNLVTLPRQTKLAQLDGAQISYWLPNTILDIQSENTRLEEIAHVGEGLSTSANDRYVRYWWEVPSKSSYRWPPLTKGGTYKKWSGLEWYVVEWEQDGIRVKTLITEKYPYLNGNYGFKIKDEEFYREQALTYSTMARGSLGIRFVEGHLFDNSGGFVATGNRDSMEVLAAILNSRVASFLVRTLTQSMSLKYTYLRRLAIPNVDASTAAWFAEMARYARDLAHLLTTQDPLERSFKEDHRYARSDSLVSSLLVTEGHIDAQVFDAYGLDLESRNLVVSETGISAGWHPLITSYDRLPDLPANLDLPPLPQEVTDYLAAHDRISPDATELARIKANLQALYEAGPGAKADDLDLEELDHHDDEEAGAAGAFIPIPTETFLEELSVKLQLHPISVYWLLEELRGEGVRCKPEEKRLLEDRLSVLVLRLLGHRWPRQIEAGEPVPAWADADGVIPLTPHTGEATLAERVRARLRAEEGDLAAQRTEALLQELTGRTLAEWLRRDFFKRHVSQFKKRPIAWQIVSGARGGGARKRSGGEPVFECVVYYHRTDTDMLARIRTQYVERLLERERGAIAHARRASTSDETAIAVATERMRELEELAARLRQVEEQGFACAELDELLAAEPLDRWSGDGIHAPASRAALLGQEQAWRVDINDGVRVNVAPLQAAGLLAADVLAGKDVRKAVADRARWRSDERRWVRAGKLPRCGWMGEAVAESETWTELAPEREKERLRLEEKRRKVVEELGAE